MKKQYVNLIAALVIFVGLVVLSTVLRMRPQTQTVGGIGVQNYIKDTLTFPYSVAIDKDLRVTGAFTAASAVIPGAVSVDSWAVAGNITMSNGALLNTQGAVTVTDNLLVVGNVDVAGNATSTSGSFRIKDDTIITGDLTILGSLSDNGAMLRLNDNTLITGTLGVSSQINAANGIAATGNVTVTGAGSYSSQVTASNGIAATGNLTVTGNITMTGQEVVGTWLVWATQGAQTVTTWITPTGTLMPITAGSWVTATIAVTGVPTGGALRLVNTGSNNICVLDSGNYVLSADWIAGQYDTLTLIFDGTRWIEIARSNN